MSATPDPSPLPIDHLALQVGESADALVLRGAVLKGSDLRRNVSRLAGWLRSQVSRKGARVASWAAKGELTCLMPLAAARAGLVHVPVNPLLKRHQVAHILSDSGAALLIANPARLAGLNDADVPATCRMVGEAEVLGSLGEAEAIEQPSQANPGDLAALLYTSGSTGRPKGVMVSHANLWLGAVSVAHYLKLRPDDVVLAVLPLSFDYGQNQLLSAWYAGASVVPLDYLAPRDIIKACARHRVTTLAAVPPLWIQLVEQEWPADASASLRRLTNSGGALGEPLVRRLRTCFAGADLYPMYGLTEAFRSTYLDPVLVDARPTSMGRAIPFAEVLVMADDEKLAEPGQTGELVHCGPLVAQGYWRDRERTAARFRPAPSQSRYGGTAVWSGDEVRRDEDGLLYFVGRHDAMIKSMGNRISPAEIEGAAIATGLASEAVAFGVPDERRGQSIHLVARGSGNEEMLISALQRDLPNFMQPKVIRFVERLPVGANGKIDRATLMEQAAGDLS